MAQDIYANLRSCSVELPDWMWDELKKEAGSDSVSAVVREKLLNAGLAPPPPAISSDAVCSMCDRMASKKYRNSYYCDACYETCDGCDGFLNYRGWRALNGPLCFNCRRPDRWHRDGLIPLKNLRRVRLDGVKVERLMCLWREWRREWRKRR